MTEAVREAEVGDRLFTDPVKVPGAVHGQPGRKGVITFCSSVASRVCNLSIGFFARCGAWRPADGQPRWRPRDQPTLEVVGPHRLFRAARRDLRQPHRTAASAPVVVRMRQAVSGPNASCHTSHLPGAAGSMEAQPSRDPVHLSRDPVHRRGACHPHRAEDVLRRCSRTTRAADRRAEGGGSPPESAWRRMRGGSLRIRPGRYDDRAAERATRRLRTIWGLTTRVHRRIW